MMLYAHDPNAPGVRGFSSELQKQLRSEMPTPLEVYDELLDADRFGNRENWEQFAAYITNKYREFHIDAVVAHGSRALQFALENLGAVFPDVPIVYGAAFEPVVDFASLPPNVTGRRILLPFAETFKLARTLQPDAERVVIVAGASAMDSVLAAAAVQDLTPLPDGMQLELLRDWSYSSLIQSLRELPEQTFVILSSFNKDWRGQTFNSGDLIPSITRAAAVPVYGIAENWVGDGVIGGGTMSLVSEGARTGQLLIRVLRRTRGERLPGQEVAVNETVVDWRQLQRWGLSDKRLPAGTRVLNRPPSTWQRYKTAILVILGVTAAQTVLITLLVLERSARARAARALEESRSQVAHIARVATMGQLGAAVTHEIRQPLTAIRVQAETGALLLAQEPPDVREARAVFRDIVSANARAVDVIDHVRMLLRK
jgi:signal transduction histidine kinase